MFHLERNIIIRRSNVKTDTDTNYSQTKDKAKAIKSRMKAEKGDVKLVVGSNNII